MLHDIVTTENTTPSEQDKYFTSSVKQISIHEAVFVNTLIEIENSIPRSELSRPRTYSWSKAMDRPRPIVKLILGRLRRQFASTKPEKKMPGTVDEAFLREFHHNTYGRPWALGRYQFDYIKSRGLNPTHRLLDFGCGSGRFAVWAIDYLNPHCYFGIDSHQESLEALTNYEIPLRQLESKSPRILLDDSINLERFGVDFDWAMDFYSSRHLDESMLSTYYTRVAASLNFGGRLLCSPKPRMSERELESIGLKIDHQERQDCSLLKGHVFEHWNDWWELVKC